MSLKLTSLLLALLFCGALAQDFEPITVLASGAGRGFDIVYERVKTPLINWAYTFGNEYNWENERFARASIFTSLIGGLESFLRSSTSDRARLCGSFRRVKSLFPCQKCLYNVQKSFPIASKSPLEPFRKTSQIQKNISDPFSALVPDQIDIQETPRTSFDSRFVLFKSYEEFFGNYIRSSSLAGSLTIGRTPLTGAFSRTKREIQDLLANNTRAASTVNNRVGLFQLNVFPNIMQDELEPGFRRAIESLPGTYDANAYGYVDSRDAKRLCFFC
jgi:hypothetical protein